MRTGCRGGSTPAWDTAPTPLCLNRTYLKEAVKAEIKASQLTFLDILSHLAKNIHAAISAAAF